MEEARISEITVGGSVLRLFRQLRRLHGTTLLFSANGWLGLFCARGIHRKSGIGEREEGSTLKCLANRGGFFEY